MSSTGCLARIRTSNRSGVSWNAAPGVPTETFIDVPFSGSRSEASPTIWSPGGARRIRKCSGADGIRTHDPLVAHSSASAACGQRRCQQAPGGPERRPQLPRLVPRCPQSETLCCRAKLISDAAPRDGWVGFACGRSHAELAQPFLCPCFRVALRHYSSNKSACVPVRTKVISSPSTQ